MKLNDNIQDIIDKVPNDCVVVAATKYVDSNDMKKLLDYGINNFGENRVDSFLKKYEELKNEEVIWHFIGHLQRNKALQIINKIDYLHSLDSIKLAHIINDNRIEPLKCFIEVNLNKEESKNGVYKEDLEDFIKQVLTFSNVKIIGLMTMTMALDSDDSKYNQFVELRELLNKINSTFNLNLKGLSMGMSDDYEYAIKASASHVRLGRILWNKEN